MSGFSLGLKVKSVPASRLFLWAFSFVLLGFAGVQVFYFSRFSELQIREIDDLAFARSIWRLYEAYSNFDFPIIFGISDYGYGWLYWTATAVLSSPGYFWYLLTGDQLWISVLPRLLSLLSVGASWYLIRRVAGQLGFSKLVQDAVGVFFLLMPPVLWFGMRFGTVSLITFLILISISQLLDTKKGGGKSLLIGSVAFGVAIGIKVSALILLPLFLLLLVERSRKELKTAWRSLAICFIAFVCSAHPPLIISVFVPEILTRWVQIQTANISNAGGGQEPFLRFVHNSSDLATSQPLYFLLFACSIFCIWQLFSRKLYSVKILIGFIFIVLLLLLLFGFAGNVDSAISYSLPYAALASLSFGFLVSFMPKLGPYVFGLVLVLLLVWNSAGLVRSLEQTGSPMNFGYYFAKYINSQEEISNAETIKKILDANGFQSIAHDFTAPVGVTPLESPNSCIHVIFDNFGRDAPCETHFEWLVLDSRKGQRSDQADLVQRAEFAKTGAYMGGEYSLVSRIGAFEVFRLVIK